MPDKFQLVDADFGKDVNPDIEAHVWAQLDWLEKMHMELHQNKIPKWRKLYLGTPAEATRNFPFPNAANTVVQVIGETVDTMAARVLGLLFATHPLWVFENYVRTQDQNERKTNENMRRVIEDYMDLVGFEPTELDLYRVEGQWFTDSAKLGTGFVKLALEQDTESIILGYADDAKHKLRGEEIDVYSGPRVRKIRHEDFLGDPSAQTVEELDFYAIRCTLKRQQLESRGFTGAYDKRAVEEILNSPDRSSPRIQTREELQQQGISTPESPDASAEWDIYECHFVWWHQGKKFRLIYNYHKRTKTVLRRVFNFLPPRRRAVVRAKLGYRNDGLYGHGYAELLENYQEELSTVHNQRLDNATVANVRALRVSPRARALDANMELYPSALLVAEKDEVEAIQVGDVYPSTFKNEEMTLGLVARRAGVSPAVAGMGTGGMMKRPAVYSAQGTLAVMQESNTNVGHATSEFRHAHAILGGALTAMYGKFGTNGKEQMFGLDADLLRRALELFEKERMRIPIRSTSGSLNKEIDKQADMIMASVMQRHYTAVGQLMQAISNPMVPEQVRQYFTTVIQAAEQLHKRILKDFGYTQPDLFVPEAPVEQQPKVQNSTVPGGNAPPGGAPVAGGSSPQPGGGGAPVPMSGMGGGASGPLPLAGQGR